MSLTQTDTEVGWEVIETRAVASWKSKIELESASKGVKYPPCPITLPKESSVIGSMPNLPLLSGSLKPASKVS